MCHEEDCNAFLTKGHKTQLRTSDSSHGTPPTPRPPPRQIEQMRLYMHISSIITQTVRIAGLYSGIYDYFNTS
jgi:hypothetical protein